MIVGSLSIDVFEPLTSTRHERFSLSISLDAVKFVLLSVFTLIEKICARICSKSQPKSAKSPLADDLCHSKILSLKLPNINDLITIMYNRLPKMMAQMKKRMKMPKAK